MTEITYSTVAAAAESIEQEGHEPGVRSVRDKLGGGSHTTINPFLRKWKEARAARDESSIDIDPAVSDLWRAQVAKAMAQASRKAELRAKDAEETFDEQAKQMAEIEAQLNASNASLVTTQAQLLQHQGLLQANEREMDSLKARTAATVAEADQRAERERAQAEAVRQELVRASLRLEQVPDLQAALDQSRQLLKASHDDVARAQRSEAVATSRAHAQQQRANESAARESRLGQQLQRLQEDREKASDAERTSQKEILRLSTMMSALDARCAVQSAEIERLRDAQKDIGDSRDAAATSTSPQHD
jgi:chromosome segregation ATPase